MAAHSKGARQEDQDRCWGRLSGARPPLPSWAPIAWWASTSAVLSVVIGLVVGQPGPLDDTDEGDQRSGFLFDADEARRVGDLDLPGDPIGRRPVLLVFDREAPDRGDLAEFVSEAPQGMAVVLVLASQPDARRTRQPAGVIADPGRRLARAVGMPEPKDCGFPVGYALVDRSARVRYATLDPSYTEHGFELDVVAEAVA